MFYRSTSSRGRISDCKSPIARATRTLAIEAERDCIRANVLTPSLIGNTEVYTRVISDPFSAKLFANAAELANLGVAQQDRAFCITRQQSVTTAQRRLAVKIDALRTNEKERKVEPPCALLAHELL